MKSKNALENSDHEDISFVDYVRRGKISTPVQKGYLRDDWAAAYGLHRVGVECDVLYWAGLSVFNALSALRRRYGDISGQPDIEAYVRSLVGLGNREQRVLRRAASEHLTFRAGESALNDVVELKLELATGSRHSLEEVSAIVVDSLTKAVGERLREPKFDLSASQRKTIESCGLDVNLCGVYRLVESLWQDCLWNGYAFTEMEGVPGVTAAPLTDESRLDVLWRVVSEYRRETLQISRASFASIEFARLDPQEKAKRVPFRLVVSIERHAGGNKFEFSTADDERASDAGQHAFFALGGMNQEYYEQLFDQPISKLGGSCMRRLIAAWLIVRSIAAAESADDVWPRIASSESLMNFARTYSQDEIVAAVAFGIDVDAGEARKLVDFMLFDGKERKTLWTHPLILLPNGDICLLAFAIEHANSTYVLERWLKYLDLNVSKKGNPFEQQVRRRLMQGRRSQALAGHLKVLQSAFTFHAGVHGRESEEIDLVLVFGKIVVIGEIKCSITPTEPIDYFNNRNIVYGAIDQVTRQASFVERNRSKFIKSLAKRRIEVTDDFRLISLVVVNNPIYVGRIVNGVTIVDPLVIERYIEGFIIESARVNAQGHVEAEHTMKFYRDFEEAQVNFEHYLNALPQFRLIMSAIDQRITEIPVHTLVNFPKISFQTFDVKINKEQLNESYENGSPEPPRESWRLVGLS